MQPNCNQQIISLYESSGGTMPLEDIVAAFEGIYTLDAIKFTLDAGSIMYRRKMKSDEGFNGKDKEQARQVLRRLLYSADENIQYKASNRILSEDFESNPARNTNIMINIINQEMQQVNSNIEKAKQAKVTIDPMHQHLVEAA